MNRKRNLIWIAAAVMAVLFVTLVLVVSPVVKWAAEKALAKEYQDFSVGGVTANIFTGKVTLKDVEASNPGLGTLTFEKVVVDIDLLPAIGKQVSIDLLQVSNATVEVRRLQDGSWAVAGLAPGGEEAVQTGAEKKSGWSWSVRRVDLNDVRVTLVDEARSKRSIVIDAEAGPVGSEDEEQKTPFEMTASLKRGIIELDGKAQRIGEPPDISGTVEIKGLDAGALLLFFVETGFKDLKAQFNADLRLAYGPAPEGDAAVVKIEGDISLDGLSALLQTGEGDISISEESLAYRGSVSYDPEKGPSAEGSLKMASLHSTRPGSDKTLLNVDGIEISGISLAGKERMAVEVVSISGVTLFEYEPERIGGDPPLPQALSISHIKGSGLALNDLRQLDIKDITVRDVEVFVFFDKGGRIEPMASLVALSGAKVKDAEAEGKEVEGAGGDGEKKQDEGLEIAVERASLEGENRLVLHDSSTAPNFRMEFASLKGEAEHIDTSGKEQASVRLSGSVGRYGTLKAQGKLGLFGQKVNSNLKADVRNVSLPQLTPYLIRNFSYRVKSGNIDVRDIRVGISNDKLDMKMDFIVNKLNVEKASGQGRQDADKILGMPFRTALSMITDDDGVIRLEVQVQGSLDDPEFEINDVLRKAILNAVKEGAVVYFGPLGVQLLTGLALPTGALGVAKKFYDYITAVRFDPVVFQPGKAEITDDQRKRLDKMAALLKDRPGIQLVICGIVVPKDHKNLFTGGEKEAPDGSAANEILLGLARERSDAVTDYLVSKGIKQKRLFVCAPEISDEKDDVPRVEVGI